MPINDDTSIDGTPLSPGHTMNNEHHRSIFKVCFWEFCRSHPGMVKSSRVRKASAGCVALLFRTGRTSEAPPLTLLESALAGNHRFHQGPFGHAIEVGTDEKRNRRNVQAFFVLLRYCFSAVPPTGTATERCCSGREPCRQRFRSFYHVITQLQQGK